MISPRGGRKTLKQVSKLPPNMERARWITIYCNFHFKGRVLLLTTRVSILYRTLWKCDHLSWWYFTDTAIPPFYSYHRTKIRKSPRNRIVVIWCIHCHRILWHCTFHHWWLARATTTRAVIKSYMRVCYSECIEYTSRCTNNHSPLNWNLFELWGAKRSPPLLTSYLPVLRIISSFPQLVTSTFPLKFQDAIQDSLFSTSSTPSEHLPFLR